MWVNLVVAVLSAVKTSEGLRVRRDGARNRVYVAQETEFLKETRFLFPCRIFCLYQGRMLVNVRGKAMVSRTWSRPQIQATVRSTPRPKPLWTTEP